MGDIANTLIQLAYRPLFEAEFSSSIDMRAWISNGRYYTEGHIHADEFCLTVKYSDYLASALINDCIRMAIASFETLDGVRREPGFKRNSAWMIIRAYYAAFFSAHAILRLYGRSCTQLDQVHLKTVFEMATALGHDAGVKKINKGFYEFVADSDTGRIICTQLADSHADTWKCLLKLIDHLIDNIESVTTLSAHKLYTVDYLFSLRNIFSRCNCTHQGNWLSRIRNQVNYHHDYGAWFPYSNSSYDTISIERDFRRWVKYKEIEQVKLDRSDIEIFIDACLSLVVLCKELIERASECSPHVEKRFRNSVVRVLNMSGRN